MSRRIHKILNNVQPTADDLMRHNIVDVSGQPHAVNAISGEYVEVSEYPDGVELQVIPVTSIAGWKLIRGYGDTIVRELLQLNSFTLESERRSMRDFGDGTKMHITWLYESDCWEVAYNDYSQLCYYLHEFQVLYCALRQEQLVIKTPNKLLV